MVSITSELKKSPTENTLLFDQQVVAWMFSILHYSEQFVQHSPLHHHLDGLQSSPHHRARLLYQFVQLLASLAPMLLPQQMAAKNARLRKYSLLLPSCFQPKYYISNTVCLLLPLPPANLRAVSKLQ